MYKGEHMMCEGEYIRELLDEASGWIGMIDEFRCKCEIMKGQDMTDELEYRMEQMQNDLAKYSCRLKEIYQELHNYGVISEV